MTCPIITFHSLDDTDSVISMTPRRFGGVVRELAAAGWRGCSVSEALAAWKRGDTGSRRVALSFDDGYRNLLDAALPAMGEAGFTATVFVVAGRCGGDNRWPGQPDSIPTLELLDWPELERLVAAGWEVGSHGLDHLTLPAMPPDRAAAELRDAREMLERRLSVAVPLLAYPYGAHDAAVRELTRSVYDAACGTRLSLVSAPDLADPFRLPRIDAYYLRGFSAAKAIDSVIGRSYLTLRRWGRRLRQRRAPAASAAGRR